MRAVLVCGPWGSGTTAVAGMLASLGAQGFGPYFITNDPRTPISYEFVPFRDAIFRHGSEETVALRPGAAEAIGSRLRELRTRIERQEFGAYDPSRPIFLNYPLSAVALEPICDIFDTQLVYVVRPLGEIERTRLRRKWPPHHGAAGAEIIYGHMADFQRRHARPTLTLNYADLLAAPADRARELARFAGLAASDTQIEEAAAFIRWDRPPGAERDAGGPRPSSGPEEQFRRAASLHEKFRWAEAEREYRRLLDAHPNHVEGLHHLGMVCIHQGKLDEAELLLRRVVAADPASPDARNHLGSLLQSLGRYDEALAHHREAIELDPEYCEAHYDLGTGLLASGKPEEAIACYRKALAIDPEWPEAHFNLALALQTVGRADEAIACYRAALALKPDYARAHGNLGNALVAQGKASDALASFEQALALNPNLAEVVYNRAAALLALGRRDEALASYDKTIALKSDYADAFHGRGLVLAQLNRYEEAIASFDTAIALKPNYVSALDNRGNVLLLNLKRYDEAIASYQASVQADPGNLYAATQSILLQGQICDWTNFASREATLLEFVHRSERVPPFSLLAVTASPSGQLAAARAWARALRVPLVGPLPRRDPRARHKIRLGYLSADFQNHATAVLMAELIERHDRARFEVYGYSSGLDEGGDMRRRLVKAFDRFVDLRTVTDLEAIRRIRQDEIDILIDLKGFTAFARTEIPGARSAPVQVNYLGYPGTMGADYIDYIIADRWVIPEDHQMHYAEKVAYLPDSYQVNDSKRAISVVSPSRTQCGLPATGFVFCSFNNSFKITPLFFDIWMRLLHQVEGSTLWLLDDNASAVRNLRKEAERRGIAPHRLVFAPRLKLEDHLARHRHADLFLDTLPCNAHTTASDALWAGLPLVTCVGSTFAGRVAASLLSAVGLPELIAHSVEDYEALALRLARSRGDLAEVKSRLAHNRATCPLFDTDRFRQHLELAYATMWERHQRGEPATGFSVAPLS